MRSFNEKIKFGDLFKDKECVFVGYFVFYVIVKGMEFW